MCSRFDEDGAHLPLKCKETWRVWHELNLEPVRCKLAEGRPAVDTMEMVFALENKTKLTVATLLWL